MLRAILAIDASAAQLDSAELRRALGWSDAEVAATLATAKARLLLWGIRVGGSPAPVLEDIELTVQGRRLLTTIERPRSTAPGAASKRRRSARRMPST